jgi:hypothetical protein
MKHFQDSRMCLMPETACWRLILSFFFIYVLATFIVIFDKIQPLYIKQVVYDTARKHRKLLQLTKELFTEVKFVKL